jgi:site-specific DNA recombinase
MRATVAQRWSGQRKTRLRDVAAAGGMDRLYVHCPDRLARNYAYQVLLVEELTARGTEVVFLNRPLGQTPEDQL